MKPPIVIVFLALTLAACAPATPAPMDTPAPTETPAPTFTFTPTSTPPTPTLTPTLKATPVPATVMPTQTSIPMITPDAIQVERWKEYQTALAKSILSFLPPEVVLCEWEILGRSGKEIYVWAICDALGGGSIGEVPAVIYLDADGTVQSVKTPGSNWSSNIRKMFPTDIQEIILNNLTNYRQLSEHLEWRQKHLEEPPLIVFLATPTP